MSQIAYLILGAFFGLFNPIVIIPVGTNGQVISVSGQGYTVIGSELGYCAVNVRTELGLSKYRG